MRKPALCICENKCADQLGSNFAADQCLCFSYIDSNIKFLNFRMPENFNCCNLPKIQTKRPNLRVFRQEDANGIANSEDPDQTAPRGAV